MPDHAAATSFIDGYRSTFETFDAASIAGLFAFPLAVTGDRADGTASTQVIHDMDQCVPALARVTAGIGCLASSVRTRRPRPSRRCRPRSRR